MCCTRVQGRRAVAGRMVSASVEGEAEERCEARDASVVNDVLTSRMSDQDVVAVIPTEMVLPWRLHHAALD